MTMATVGLMDTGYHVGRDFLDALLAERAAVSRGDLRVGDGVVHRWVSTLSCVDSERILRKAASDDGVRITRFTSQGV